MSLLHLIQYQPKAFSNFVEKLAPYFCQSIIEKFTMSYADATKGNSSESSGNSSRENADGKFYNGKLLVCMVRGFCCEDVADALHKLGVLRVVTGIQTLDYNRRIGVEISDEGVRSKILMDGLVIKYHTVTFSQHGSKDATRVYVHQLPLGISEQEVRAAFEAYGSIGRVQPKVMSYHGKRMLNGEWCLHFNRLADHIPSYVSVRGWTAYVNYRGQPRTCRICNGLGHLARDCPIKKNENDQDQPMNTDSHEPGAQASSPEPEVKTPEKPAEPASDSDSLFSDLDTPKKSLQREIFGTETEISAEETDRDSKSTVWADDMEDESKTQEDANQKVEGVTGPKPYCPRCREYTHTEAQCIADVIRLANKRKSSGTEESKPGKAGKDFKRFKSDLAQVVLRGRRVEDFQYILEMDNYNEVCAYYMVVHFEALSGTLATTNSEHKMAGNTEVMDLWAKFTSEGKNADDAIEHLRTAFEHV